MEEKLRELLALLDEHADELCTSDEGARDLLIAIVSNDIASVQNCIDNTIEEYE